MPKFQDGEVIRIDLDGNVVQWSDEDNAPYNCGETLDEWGIHNLRDAECGRVGVTLAQRDRARSIRAAGLAAVAKALDEAPAQAVS